MNVPSPLNTQPPYIVTFTGEDSVIKPTVGLAPLGYKKAFINNQIVVVPNEEAAPKVVLAFELATKGRTFREILPILKTKGLVSSRGNELSLSSLHNMLTNPFYIGLLRTSNEACQGKHKPLISKSQFERVQRNLKNKRCKDNG